MNSCWNRGGESKGMDADKKIFLVFKFRIETEEKWARNECLPNDVRS